MVGIATRSDQFEEPIEAQAGWRAVFEKTIEGLLNRTQFDPWHQGAEVIRVQLEWISVVVGIVGHATSLSISGPLAALCR